MAPGGAGGGLAGLGLEVGGFDRVQFGGPGVALGHGLDVVDGVVRVVHGVHEGGEAALAQRLAHPDVGFGEAGADVGEFAGHDDGESGVAVEFAALVGGGGAGDGVGFGGEFARVVHAGDEVGAVLLAGGGDHRLELVVGVAQPDGGVRVAALGDVLGVGVGVGGEGARQHLEAGDEAVAVGDVFEEGAEAVDEGFLVLAVAQADAGSFDFDGGGDGAAVGVEEDGDLVGAEGRGEPVDAADAGGGPISTSRPSEARTPASTAPER